MSYRCYFRPGTIETIWGIGCETLVVDDENQEQLLADGWHLSPLDFDKPAEAPEVDEALSLLRAAAKERGIKGYGRMSEDTLRAALGLNDGSPEE